MGGRVGYEHRCRFWVEDEITKLYKFEVDVDKRSFLFEIRTHFIIKRRPEEGGSDEVLASERIDACVLGEEFGESCLDYSVGSRLKEYWMTCEEIISLTHEAFDFARRMAADPQHACRRVMPVVVGVDVCTVQQEGEPLVSTMDRAIRAENLIPLYLCSPAKFKQLKPTMRAGLAVYMRRLPRIRVEDVDKGLALMQTCRFCSRKPTVGAQISSLPCGHAFHSHCLVKYLEANKLCPVCHSEAVNFPYLFKCGAFGSG